ncbi:hypothetical protein B0A50_04283 [Salinomyces thailandicus]|uniref:DUF726-domain-containing protein n=1 Tax=Salinomyces thailandicus TaxID=706561 RepID=A0A4U0TWX4_9PEZI|nr:hypothetical protein B0A50_04283 [Salinomyces thailandica]
MGKQQGEGNERDETLATLLSDSGHEELFIEALQQIASSMRDDLDSVFSLPRSDNEENNHDVELVLDDDGTAQGTAASPQPGSDRPGVQAEIKPKDKAAKQREKVDAAITKEVHSEEFRELRQRSLHHFDDWSTQALGRIQDELRLEMTEHELPSSTAGRVTSLADLPEPHRVMILHSCLLLLLGLESYPAESRIFLKRLSAHLNLANSILVNDERQVAQGLVHAAESGLNADEETKKRLHDKKVRRRWMIGAGAAAGATLIGITGGLAAPLLAAGVGSAMAGIGLGSTAVATYLGAMAGSAPLIGALFGAYGGKMAGEMVGNYSKEVSDFAFIPVRKSTFTKAAAVRRLRIAIGVSGWITEPTEVVKPWQFIGKEGFESYALRWELNNLLDLGHAMTTYAKSATWGFAKAQIISQTILATLSAALWPLSIAKAARLVDNPFSIALQRSIKAGKVLADALINKAQGERPVTLLGYSLGARVIVACLEELARRRAFGLVENVVLAGSATSRDTKVWRRVRAVVTGRVVNAYSTNDYLLAFLFRTHNLNAGVAGLQPVEHVHGVENVDVSSIVKSHFQYRFLTGQIMSAVGLEDIDQEAVKRETERMKKEQAQVEKERQEKERLAKEQGLSSDDEAKMMEEQLQKQRRSTKERMSSAMSGMKDKFSKMSVKKGAKGRDEEASASDSASEYNTDITTSADGKRTDPAKESKAVGSTVGGFVPAP